LSANIRRNDFTSLNTHTVRRRHNTNVAVNTVMGCLHDPAFIQLAGSSMVIRRTGGL